MDASALYPDGRFMVEDLLDFTLGAGDEDDDDETRTFKAPSSSSSNPSIQDPDDHQQSLALPEFVEEEELEWLSNKDAFPAVETCLDILSGNPGIVPNHQGLLENSSGSSNSSNGSTITSCRAGCILVPVRYPVKARSKRRWRRRHGISEQWLGWSQAKAKKAKPELPPPPPPSATATIGRRCLHCRAEKTPQWRAGPMGPKTLCNACGVRYKSGRLVPEYRPASSPTFSSLVHSNSHRKIIEMRRQKQPGGMVNEACGYRVG